MGRPSNSRKRGVTVTRVCCYCQSSFEIATGAANRAEKGGFSLYCNRECAGMGRRLKNPPTDAERRAAKAEYDRQYRERNAEEMRRKKSEYFKRTYDPEKAKIVRAARMHLHVEYCRQPWYKAWKRQYDQGYRAKKFYGEFADVMMALQELEQEIEVRGQEEVNLDKAREKTNERRNDRAGEGTDGGQPESGALANPARLEGWQYPTTPG